jgi:beta-phosphoglucomutase
MSAPPQAPALAEGLALLFDMDGVLIHSNPEHRKAWHAFIGQYGLRTTDEVLTRLHGKRNDRIIRELFGPGLEEEEVQRRCAAKEEVYRSIVATRVREILVPGILPFLEHYRAAPMAVATNAERANLSFLLDSTGLAQFFRVALDGNQVEKPKPDPEIYLRAAELLGVAPVNAIVFEDSPYGVEAARAAGMRVIGLSTTYVNLPGTAICVDNFLSRELFSWLGSQKRAA